MVALNEGPPGMGPVLRPGGIELKDGLLFAALGAKTVVKSFGIPKCEGAATKKSPWNAPGMVLTYYSRNTYYMYLHIYGKIQRKMTLKFMDNMIF